MNVDAEVKLHLFPHSHKSLEGITATRTYTAYAECFAMNHIKIILMCDALIHVYIRLSLIILHREILNLKFNFQYCSPRIFVTVMYLRYDK
jgi:hypothetical protein